MDYALAGELAGAYSGRHDIEPTWRIVDIFSIVDAAALAAGFDPVFVQRCCQDTHFDRYFPQYLVMHEAITGAIEAETLAAPWIGKANTHERDWVKTKMRRADLIAWLRSKGVTGGFFGAELAAKPTLQPATLAIPSGTNAVIRGETDRAERLVSFAASTPLSHWDVKQEFTGHDAAGLVVGIDPAHPNNEWWRNKPTLERMEESYEKARSVCSIAYHSDLAPDYEAPISKGGGEVLVSVSMILVIEMQKVADVDYEIPKLTIPMWLASGGSEFRNQTFSRHELHRWLSANSILSAYDFAGSDVVSRETTSPPTARQESSHVIEVLGIAVRPIIALWPLVRERLGVSRSQAIELTLRYLKELRVLIYADDEATGLWSPLTPDKASTSLSELRSSGSASDESAEIGGWDYLRIAPPDFDFVLEYIARIASRQADQSTRDVLLPERIVSCRASDMVTIAAFGQKVADATKLALKEVLDRFWHYACRTPSLEVYDLGATPRRLGEMSRFEDIADATVLSDPGALNVLGSYTLLPDDVNRIEAALFTLPVSTADVDDAPVVQSIASHSSPAQTGPGEMIAKDAPDMANAAPAQPSRSNDLVDGAEGDKMLMKTFSDFGGTIEADHSGKPKISGTRAALTRTGAYWGRDIKTVGDRLKREWNRQTTSRNEVFHGLSSKRG